MFELPNSLSFLAMERKKTKLLILIPQIPLQDQTNIATVKIHKSTNLKPKSEIKGTKSVFGFSISLSEIGRPRNRKPESNPPEFGAGANNWRPVEVELLTIWDADEVELFTIGAVQDLWQWCWRRRGRVVLQWCRGLPRLQRGRERESYTRRGYSNLPHPASYWEDKLARSLLRLLGMWFGVSSN